VSTPSLSSTTRRRFGHTTGNERRRAPLQLRLRVAMHRHRLDRELADGAAPVRSCELGLRAEQLVYGSSRHQIAGSLRRAVADANGRPRYVISAAAPVARSSVRLWSHELLGVADMLEWPGTVNARGVARAFELVCDGSGPLYSSAPEQTLGSALEAITEGFVPDDLSGLAGLAEDRREDVSN
jgi:hypothetical protein